MNEWEEDEAEREDIEAEDNPRVKAGKIRVRRIRRILEFTAGCLILSVLIILFSRIFSANTPSELRDVIVTEKLTEVLEKNGKTTCFYQQQDTITRAEKCYGYFSVPDYGIFEETGEVQLIFRYNKSTLSHVQEDYNLEKTPDKEEDQFDLSLLIVNKDGTKTRIFPTEYKKKNTYRYSFYRYVFDGVTVTDDTEAIYLDIYYKNDVNYEEEAYGTLRLYNYDNEYGRVTETVK